MQNINIRMTKRTEETPFVKTASEAFRSSNIHWFSSPYCMMVAEQTKDIINASIYQNKGEPLQVRTLCDVIGAVAENETLTVEHVTCGWRTGEGWETAVIRVWNLEAYEGRHDSDQLMRDLTPFKRSCKKGADSPLGQKVVEAIKSDLVCYSEPRERVEAIAHSECEVLVLVGAGDEEGYVSPLFLNTLIESIHSKDPQMRVRQCRFYDKQGVHGWKMVLIQIFDEERLRADIRARRAAQSEREERQGPLTPEQRKTMRKIRQLLIDAGANPILNRDPDEDPNDFLDI